MSLPNTYTEVEYIESTGTQYINVNVSVANIYGYEIEFESTDYITNQYNVNGIMGTNNASTIDLKLWFNVSGDTMHNSISFWDETVSSSEIPYVSPSEYYKKHNIKILNRVCYYDGEEVHTFTNTAPSAGPSTIYIFAMCEHNWYVSHPSKTRLYYLKIYGQNNVLLRDFVPCYRKSDMEIGLYDLVNNTFYTNSGTGEFLKGPSSTATKLEYLNETKELIKQAIISKGQTITAQDTFRSYADKIDNVTVVDSEDWSNIGYSHREPQVSINDGFEYALEISNDWQNVANLSEKFSEDRDMKYMPLVDTSNATNMSKFMYNCYRLETLPELDTSNVTNMSYVLYNCRALKTIPNWNFSNVTNMSYAFYYNTSLEHFDADSIDTSKVTNWGHTFEGCFKLTDEEIQKFDFSGASGTLENMFAYCEGLTSISIPSLPNVTSPSQMFVYCKNLKTINLPSMPKLASTYAPFHSSGIETIIAFDTSNVTNANQLFYNATKLTNIPVFDFSNVTNFGGNIFLYSSGSRFTDQSLNNLMESLISAIKYTGTKTLKYIGLSKAKCERCMELEKYQDFVDAGWLTGYET